MPGLGNLWPRYTCNQGSDKVPTLLGVRGMGGAPAGPLSYGWIGFQTLRGNGAFLYVDYTTPPNGQLRFGGLAELGTAGGAAMGGLLPPGIIDETNMPNFCIYGSPRVQSGIVLAGSAGPPAAAAYTCPAIGLMVKVVGAPTNIWYLYVTDDGTTMTLNVGDEATWLAGTVNGSWTHAPSGATVFDPAVRVTGQSVLSDNYRTYPAPLVVQSGGGNGNAKAGLGFIRGDYGAGIALYAAWNGNISIDTVANWLISTNA